MYDQSESKVNFPCPLFSNSKQWPPNFKPVLFLLIIFAKMGLWWSQGMRLSNILCFSQILAYFVPFCTLNHENPGV